MIQIVIRGSGALVVFSNIDELHLSFSWWECIVLKAAIFLGLFREGW